MGVAGVDVPHDEEENWVRQAQAGDRAAFAALVDRYWSRIYRWLHGMADGAHTAEDLTQEVFLKAWAHLGSFTPGTRFTAWIFRIARNCLIDGRRRAGVRPRQPLSEGLTAHQPGPVATVVGRETQARVREAVDRLPERFREPFLLRTQEELSYQEIAQAMGLREVTVRWRVCKARQLLLEELKPILDHEDS